MIYGRSLRPAAQLLGAFVGVALGTIARSFDHAATAIIRRIR